jgi:protein dithiol:quinone oxidoreductase
MIRNLLQPARLPFTVALCVSLSLVGGGVLLAQLLSLAACPLCVIQRMLYLLLALAAGSGLVLAARPLARTIAALSMATIAAAGSGVAAYQVWIQRFAPNTTCGAEMPWWEAFVEWAGRLAPMLFQPNGLCSDPAWKLLGLSIAEWSLLSFFGLFLLGLFSLLRRAS